MGRLVSSSLGAVAAVAVAGTGVLVAPPPASAVGVGVGVSPAAVVSVSAAALSVSAGVTAGSADVTLRAQFASDSGFTSGVSSVDAGPGLVTAGASATATASLANPDFPGHRYWFRFLVSDGVDEVEGPTGSVVTPGTPGAAGLPVLAPGAVGRSMQVFWPAPVDDGGAEVTGYRVVDEDRNVVCSTSGERTCMATGLDQSQDLSWRVQAGNAMGWGRLSALAAPMSPAVTTIRALVRGAGAAVAGAASRVRVQVVAGRAGDRVPVVGFTGTGTIRAGSDSCRVVIVANRGSCVLRPQRAGRLGVSGRLRGSGWFTGSAARVRDRLRVGAFAFDSLTARGRCRAVARGRATPGLGVWVAGVGAAGLGESRNLAAGPSGAWRAVLRVRPGWVGVRAQARSGDRQRLRLPAGMGAC